MFLSLAIILFAVFATNVTMGSFDQPLFLSDVQEMLLLFAASLAFVVAILNREARSRSAQGQDKTQTSILKEETHG